MDFESYKSHIANVKTGKQLPDAVYIHQSAETALPEELSVVLGKIASALKISSTDWNILKLYKRDFKVAFLSYPVLKHSYTVDLSKLSMCKASYEKSDNPPILHRKETFVKEDFPLTSEFKEITAEGEKIGLYENTRNIGFRRNWERLISNKGYYLDEEGRLHPKADRNTAEVVPISEGIEVECHRTAIDRSQLPAPMQVLARHNYLTSPAQLRLQGCILCLWAWPA